MFHIEFLSASCFIDMAMNVKQIDIIDLKRKTHGKECSTLRFDQQRVATPILRASHPRGVRWSVDHVVLPVDRQSESTTLPRPLTARRFRPRPDGRDHRPNEPEFYELVRGLAPSHDAESSPDPHAVLAVEQGALSSDALRAESQTRATRWMRAAMIVSTTSSSPRPIAPDWLSAPRNRPALPKLRDQSLRDTAFRTHDDSARFR